MNPATEPIRLIGTNSPLILSAGCILVSDARYEVRLASGRDEIETALRLRYRVFKLELGNRDADDRQIEFDSYDFMCRHLIVVERSTGTTIGTYRMNAIESASDVTGFYSYTEFSIEDLPQQVLDEGVEIGRACISPEHRNTKVLFLLWKGLANYLKASKKRFFFGCCSIFTRDPLVGEKAFHQLAQGGHFHRAFRVEPRKNALYLSPVDQIEADPIELPGLFNMYMRIGAKVCGPPMIDPDFGTIDFFVVFDRQEMSEKYRKMFF